MSIRLDYRVDPSWTRTAQKLNFLELTQFDFDTSVMPGDQLFEIDGKDFSYQGYSIPLLQFARSLLLSILELERGASNTFSHPLDIGEEIDFVQVNDAIFVSSALTGQSATVNKIDLGAQIRCNAKRLLVDVLNRHPDATMSRALYQWYPVHELELQKLFAFD